MKARGRCCRGPFDVGVDGLVPLWIAHVAMNIGRQWHLTRALQERRHAGDARKAHHAATGGVATNLGHDPGLDLHELALGHATTAYKRFPLLSAKRAQQEQFDPPPTRNLARKQPALEHTA